MSDAVSRRNVLSASATGLMAAGVALLSASNVRAADLGSSNQLRKEDVRYQDQPKGNQSCAGCKNFVHPGACRVVTGPVSPNGWCLLFKAKAS